MNGRCPFCCKPLDENGECPVHGWIGQYETERASKHKEIPKMPREKDRK